MQSYMTPSITATETSPTAAAAIEREFWRVVRREGPEAAERLLEGVETPGVVKGRRRRVDREQLAHEETSLL